MWSFLFVFPLGALAALQTGTCDYSRTNSYNGETYCIEPKQSASVEFDLAPLFPKGAKFVYAVDDVKNEDLQSMEPLLDDDKTSDWESTMTGWWLEYEDVSLNNTDLYMITDMVVAYTNSSDKIGGSYNGCEDLIGKECIDSINATMHELWADNRSPLYYLDQNFTVSSRNSSCPSDLFLSVEKLQRRIDTLNKVGELHPFYIAIEAPINTTIDETYTRDDVMPSSNKSMTYSRTLYSPRELSYQEHKAAVAILFRYPPARSWTNRKVRNTTADDATLVLACTKLSESSSDDDSDNQDSDSESSSKEDVAIATGVQMSILSVAMLSALLLLNI